MIAIHVTSLAALVTFLPDMIYSQEANYYWNDEVTTTSFPQETTTNVDFIHNRRFIVSSFDEKLTPFFIVNSEVCNDQNVLVFPLQTTGPKINFTISRVENGDRTSFMIDERQRVILTDKVKFRETSIHISAVNAEPPESETDSLAAIFPSSSTITIQRENFLVIKVSISDSFCPGSQSSTTTIVIVSLSVLCIVFLASFSMAMIALRRSRPSLFNSKHKMNGNCNQVGPGPMQINNLNAQQEGSFERDAVKCSPSVNLKPIKSSLKVTKRVPEVPDVSITCDSPDLSLSLRTLCQEEEVAENVTPNSKKGSEEAPADINDCEDVVTMNGEPSPSLSASGSTEERRRPSAVTFNETTQIIQIARKKK